MQLNISSLKANLNKFQFGNLWRKENQIRFESNYVYISEDNAADPLV